MLILLLSNILSYHTNLKTNSLSNFKIEIYIYIYYISYLWSLFYSSVRQWHWTVIKWISLIWIRGNDAATKFLFFYFISINNSLFFSEPQLIKTYVTSFVMKGLADKGLWSKQYILGILLFPKGKSERLLNLFWDINVSEYFCLYEILQTKYFLISTCITSIQKKKLIL